MSEERMKWREVKPQEFGRFNENGAEPTRQDPYDLLGLTRDATDEEVKRAYRKLMSANHPDKLDRFIAGSANRRAQEVNAAYDKICADRAR